MPYKVYNELPGVGTTAKTLIPVIYYNVYNMMGWTPGTGANVQPWQYSLPDANGDTRTGANVHPWQYFLPDANGDTRRVQMCIRGNTPCLMPTGTPDGRKDKKRSANFLQTGNG